jgi:outer membrane lipoprotein-sorting protein
MAVIAAGGTAIALGASSGGPVPPAKPLAVAVHDALGARDVSGISARVDFTNHLVDSAAVEGSAPLLKGATGRLWLTKDRVRVELQSDQGDAQLVSNGKTFWVYDVTSNTVYRGRVPQDPKSKRAGSEAHRVPSLNSVRDAITKLMRHAGVSRAVPGDVAGRPAYTVRVSPKRGGLVGAGQLAFDAARGVPLEVGVYARGSSSPVLELKARDVSYGPVPASTFQVAPPKGAKVVDVSSPGAKGSNGKTRSKRREVSGRAAVAAALPFKLAAPSTLAGQRLSEVHLIDWKGSPGAAAGYGRGLGGIAVLERKAEPAKPTRPQRGEHGRSLTLPQVRIGGVSVDELATPLGTVLRFERGGVSYIVAGSVSKTSAEAAVRSLLR